VRPLDDGERAAYLRRLGLDRAPDPTLATLVDLHRRHLVRVPYENLGIMLGEPPSVDPLDSVTRVGEVGRLGYCFHQNGAAELLLRSLGYAVQRRHGHVWTGRRVPMGPLNHLVLVVEVPGEAGRWWFDVGLGDGFAEPLALADGPVRDRAGFEYALESVSMHGWSFRHDAHGTFGGVTVTSRPSDPTPVEEAHRRLSTDPESPFRRLLVCQRRDATGVETVRGVLWSRVEPGRHEERELAGFDDWCSVIQDRIGLPLKGFDGSGLRDLFERMLAVHREWLASRDG
jgi:arylamine N-acetyltransferase